jgi:putative SOS response-associated peptidase YedK
MCGRYGRRADKQRIAEWMQTHNTDVFDDSYLAPSYNVAPQSFQPVVRLDSETGERELTIMRWGLIPFWILLANSLFFAFIGSRGSCELLPWTSFAPGF